MEECLTCMWQLRLRCTVSSEHRKQGAVTYYVLRPTRPPTLGGRWDMKQVVWAVWRRPGVADWEQTPCPDPTYFNG